MHHDRSALLVTNRPIPGKLDLPENNHRPDDHGNGHRELQYHQNLSRN